VLTALGADLHRGLSDKEAAARLATYGHNEVAPEAAILVWRRFLAQFKDVLVILLLVATAVSVALWIYERATALPVPLPT
jgi:Ca2+-transporting ATPase